MTTTQTWLAPAKLNLFLHITGRRPDGYHELQTIFQFLDYCDELDFSVRDDSEIHCQTNTDLASDDNLIVKAAKLLQQHTQTTLGANIQLRKKIPMGGGLGGGSSNAATTLLALNELWELGLSQDTLQQLGVQLGADVPIFIYGQSAWAEGIGERLEPVTLSEDWFLVIHPNCHVPTGEIFSNKLLTRDKPLITIAHFLAGNSENVCETVVCQLYPEVKEALDWLNQFNPARMTGTGACIFTQCKTQEQAQHILAKLPSKWQGFVSQGRNRSLATVNK
ncbi:4-(cytidine 5'-diphospho)-2-C-methyl-D-erythritol kinase [Candidatus Albibeggiatoa sp. nov. NOAA]|uniref:4-(cytidine 5'-diphospho)-2-C-methyl-D-erythritol kinase n=1 Tax=Candidatus Albibeggiatoa sp. nov. NOAA TaxID=3162724 RepID=UPI003301BBE8|nr:4-(cytidine 5'-diphospho)-2-C-methyl-D-erythritol kinase [Thiotrichaceae bacterium]